MTFPSCSGMFCDTNIDDCTEGICKNGTCSDGANTYTCNCLNGYTGENCEVGCLLFCVTLSLIKTISVILSRKLVKKDYL